MLRARFHGQWSEAQLPTKYAYVMAGDEPPASITVPAGERWLLRAWDLTDLAGGAPLTWAQIRIWHKETDEEIPLDHDNMGDTPVVFGWNSLGHADINPVILQQGDIIYFYAGVWTPDTLKCTVWYEQLDAIDVEPQKVEDGKSIVDK